MRTKTTLLICSLLLVLAGCGAGHPANTNTEVAVSHSVSGIDMTAKVNPDTAAVDLPGDKFNLSRIERYRLMDAGTVARAACAKRLGIPFLASGVGRGDAPEYAMFGELGPWTEEMANRFAFTGPSTIYDQVANGYIPEPKDFKHRKSLPELSDEQDSLLMKECNGTPEDKYFDEDRFDRSSPPAAYDLLFTELMKKKLTDSREYRAALSDLKQCYKETGIDLTDEKENNPYTVIVGADYHKVNEQQIALALKDVQCKSKVDFVNRVVQEAAKLQAPIIEKNIKELTAWRAEADATLKKAKEYINAHQDVILKD